MNVRKFKKPIHHLIISNFLSKENFSNLKKHISQIEYEFKDSDLFTFYQSCDLTNTKSIQIRNFKQQLTGNKMQKILLNEFNFTSKTLDLAAQKYLYTNYLLPHDDRLENRKVAFIFYLSNLNKNQGGSLDFFDTKIISSPNEKNPRFQPTKIVKSFYPEENTLLLFEVSQKSFHQVSEILSSSVERYSVSGWFYGQ